MIKIATVQTIIDNARYDLGDFGGQKYDDTQMLHHMNRMVAVLDDTLIGLNSDLTKTSTTVTISSGSNTASLPTRCDRIIKVWKESDLWLQESLDQVMYRFQINDATSATGLPQYWAHNGANIYFNITTDQEYTVTVYFHQRTATLALASDMPYNDLFNEFLREAIVNMAQKAKDNQIPGVDQQFYGTFKNLVHRQVISREWMRAPKFYKDF